MDRSFAIRIAHPADGTDDMRLDVGEKHVMDLALLPDRRLASSGDDLSVLAWDVMAGVESVRIEGAGSGAGLAVTALAALPDGRLVTDGQRTYQQKATHWLVTPRLAHYAACGADAVLLLKFLPGLALAFRGCFSVTGGL